MTNQADALARPTWFEIDLEAVAHNVRQLRSMVGPGVAVYACLKRNAYGCGAVPVGRTSLASGAHGLAVGNIQDALALRKDGIAGPILLYPTCLPAAGPVVEAADLTLSISTSEEAASWDRALKAPRPVFLKIDVGLLRAGAAPDAVEPLIAAVQGARRLKSVGLYGHFFSYGADATDADYQWQFAQFNAAQKAAESLGLRPPVVMVSSTSAVVKYPEMDLSGVDPGRLLFGLDAAGKRAQGKFRPAFVALKTRILMRKTLAMPPTGVAPPFPVRPGMSIGILPIGWGDGLPRRLPEGASALVRGKRAPLLNPVHLEHLRIDLTDVPEAEPGDEVVLVGRQCDEYLALEEVAKSWGMDATTFHGSMRDHIPRVYV